ncbi:MAG: NAD(P)H-dependent glycerol-3-phosphate dehydrogenase [Gammaproteobacteria bacterium]
MNLSNPITVLGSGAWGTALAILLARNQQSVRLWGRDLNELLTMQRERVNSRYLPGAHFPDNLHIIPELPSALAGAEEILVVVPSQGFRPLLETIKPLVPKQPYLAWGTKGLEPETDRLLHEVAQEIFGSNLSLAVLSGPNFAHEVAANLPTALTLASNNVNFAKRLRQRLHNANFRVYLSTDVAGVECCGAVKNVMAIAVGIADGLELGANARCALITRGLAEMTRLGLALGGKAETFTGLAGVGDLVLTATDNQSRNRRLGLLLGKGCSVEDAVAEINKVIEGVQNASKVYDLAHQLGIEMPITEQVCKVLYENVSPAQAVKALLARKPQGE